MSSNALATAPSELAGDAGQVPQRYRQRTRKQQRAEQHQREHYRDQDELTGQRPAIRESVGDHIRDQLAVFIDAHGVRIWPWPRQETMHRQLLSLLGEQRRGDDFVCARDDVAVRVEQRHADADLHAQPLHRLLQRGRVRPVESDVLRSEGLEATPA
jgi:hypothetical protein